LKNGKLYFPSFSIYVKIYVNHFEHQVTYFSQCNWYPSQSQLFNKSYTITWFSITTTSDQRPIL